MSKLLRYFGPGQYCFVTSITADRQRILDQHTDFLARAVHRAHQKSLFSVVAWVVLPDHFHALIYAPNGDTARIVQRVKLSYSLQLKPVIPGDRAIWQNRYWDHIIRSEEDMRRCIDYIHYNPVKHGLTDSPGAWPLTSIRRYMRSGKYELDWGVVSEDFGEDTFGE
jgi:putative transposase